MAYIYEDDVNYHEDDDIDLSHKESDTYLCQDHFSECPYCLNGCNDCLL